MKLVNLAEGSERLFHLVSVVYIESVISSGRLVLSQLMTKGNEYSAMERAYGKTSKLYFLSLARSLRSEFISDASAAHTQCIFEFSSRKLSRYGRVVPINFFNAEGAEKVDEMEDRLLSDRGVIPISECECVHVICPNKFIGRFKEMHERYGVEVRFYRKYADLVSLRNWVALDDMIRGASEISSGKYSTIVDVHGSGEIYRELGLAISSYLGNREVNFDLGLVRGFIKGRRISDVVWRLRVFFPDDGPVVAGEPIKDAVVASLSLLCLSKSFDRNCLCPSSLFNIASAIILALAICREQHPRYLS